MASSPAWWGFEMHPITNYRDDFPTNAKRWLKPWSEIRDK